jgi:hypothetical protein
MPIAGLDEMGLRGRERRQGTDQDHPDVAAGFREDPEGASSRSSASALRPSIATSSRVRPRPSLTTLAIRKTPTNMTTAHMLTNFL